MQPLTKSNIKVFFLHSKPFLLQFKTSGTLPIVIEESIYGTLSQINKEKTKRSQHGNQLDLETLGSRPIKLCPKISSVIVSDKFE
jgi:hypothetical protein